MIRTLIAFVIMSASAVGADALPVAVVRSDEASFQVRLAAGEVRRYLYLRTGALAQIAAPGDKTKADDVIVIAVKGARHLKPYLKDKALAGRIAALGPQQYAIKTVASGSGRAVIIAGGDPVGALYGAYKFIEHFGVRFYLHGDVIPDKRIAWKTPDLDETHKPLFALRGINTWGSHPFGFDQWGSDDYRSIIAQLAKMRMNFIGMHCYLTRPYTEPTVWIGTRGNFDNQGRVTRSYAARYYNTLWKGHWGPILPGKTGDYPFGAAMMFEDDAWGPDVLKGLAPTPTTPEGRNKLFNRVGVQFNKAFGFAKLVGVKTCLGTEAPMKKFMPKELRASLTAGGHDPNSPDMISKVYQGVFERIKATHPLDYYWIWTPEGWTWRGNSAGDMQATVDDVKIAAGALKKVGSPFKLATSGWVLGPKGDRAAFDKMVPKSIAMSAISRVIGYTPVDPAYGEITDREKWAIPWLESDDFLASPQLWVGRTRKDAADALGYKCNGLMGLHWRTRIMGPNASALARAGWDQSWNTAAARTLATTMPNAPAVKWRGGNTPRGLPAGDFYRDWTLTSFGAEVADKAAAIFEKVDGKVPQPLGRRCPSGTIRADARQWDKIAGDYTFVDNLAAIRPQVKGAGNRERFDYWLNTFKYQRSLAKIQCMLGAFNAALKANPKTALPLYKQLIAEYAQTVRLRMNTVTTHGGIATIVNLLQHSKFRPAVIDNPAKQLTAALGGTLPADASPPKTHQGPGRIIVPTVRTSLVAGESLTLKAIVLSETPAKTVTLNWRRLGGKSFRKVPLKHVARGVYSITLGADAIGGNDFEYYITAQAAGAKLHYPVTAPKMNNTVIVVGR